MWFTEYKEEDGYIEQIISLVEESTPIFRLRAVLGSDGKYNLVVRDYQTGCMMSTSNFASKSWYEVLKEGQKECKRILEEPYIKDGLFGYAIVN